MGYHGAPASPSRPLFRAECLEPASAWGTYWLRKHGAYHFPYFSQNTKNWRLLLNKNYIFPAIKWIWIPWSNGFHMISYDFKGVFIILHLRFPHQPAKRSFAASSPRPPAGNSMLWHLRHRLRPQQIHRGHQQRMIRISIALRLPFSEAMYSGYLWLWCVGKTRIAMEKREKYWKLISQLATTSHCAVPALWFFHCPNVYLWLLC